MKNGKKPTRKPSNKNLKGGDIVSNSSKFDHIQPVQALPVEVKVYNNFDKAMKAFRALVQKERTLSLYKEKQSFEKPSDKKRRKRNEMKRKLLELESKSRRDAENAYDRKYKKDETTSE